MYGHIVSDNLKVGNEREHDRSSEGARLSVGEAVDVLQDAPSVSGRRGILASRRAAAT